jgi:LysR family hydrogen peroxide-inducible transcriptional activator
MVAHGLGVTLVPEMAASAAGVMPDLRIVPFQEPMPQRMICLAWRRNKARHDECVELAKIVRGLGEAVLAA